MEAGAVSSDATDATDGQMANMQCQDSKTNLPVQATSGIEVSSVGGVSVRSFGPADCAGFYKKWLVNTNERKVRKRKIRGDSLPPLPDPVYTRVGNDDWENPSDPEIDQLRASIKANAEVHRL